uniref:Uncharacterized protein n=1 Tax=Strigamia maritima TaxID=126957 RepID=T1ILB5_STRMM
MARYELRWVFLFIICFRSCYFLPIEEIPDCHYPHVFSMNPKDIDCTNTNSHIVMENCNILSEMAKLICSKSKDEDVDIPKISGDELKSNLCKNISVVGQDIPLLTSSNSNLIQIGDCNNFCFDSDLNTWICVNILYGAKKLLERSTTQTEDQMSIITTKTTINEDGITKTTVADGTTVKIPESTPITTNSTTITQATISITENIQSTMPKVTGEIHPKNVIEPDFTGGKVTSQGEDGKEEIEDTATGNTAGVNAEGKTEHSPPETTVSTSTVSTTTTTVKDTPPTTVLSTVKDEVMEPGKPVTEEKITPKEDNVDGEVKPKEKDESDDKFTSIDQDTEPNDDVGQTDEGENTENYFNTPEEGGDQLRPPVKNPIDENTITGGSMPGPEFPQYDSHFFIYFLTAIVLCVLLYLAFHNKQKIIALIIEGRHERRRRSSNVSYKKLDNNLDQVLHGTKGSSTVVALVY